MNQKSMNRKTASAVAVFITVAALLPSAWIAWHFRAMPQMGAYHDDAVYLESAKSLAEGHDYRIPSLPDAPYQTKYPPVFPFLMSLIWRIDPQFPGNLSKLAALWMKSSMTSNRFASGWSCHWRFGRCGIAEIRHPPIFFAEASTTSRGTLWGREFRLS